MVNTPYVPISRHSLYLEKFSRTLTFFVVDMVDDAQAERIFTISSTMLMWKLVNSWFPWQLLRFLRFSIYYHAWYHRHCLLYKTSPRLRGYWQQPSYRVSFADPIIKNSWRVKTKLVLTLPRMQLFFMIGSVKLTRYEGCRQYPHTLYYYLHGTKLVWYARSYARSYGSRSTV